MFTDKVKIEGTFLDDLSPEELAGLVKGLKEAGFGKAVDHSSGNDPEASKALH